MPLRIGGQGGLLDWNMPGRTGLDVIEWANANLDAPPPFVLLTSRQEKTDIVRGLEAGAVDFIVKPESDQVIRARIEAAGRRTAASGPARRGEFGIYRLDRLDRTITVNGDPVHLTSKEFELADLFFQNLDRPLSRSYLFSKVWRSTAEIETRTLDMHISRIRSKLKLKPENGYVVRTVFGFGYRMDEYIEALEEG